MLLVDCSVPQVWGTLCGVRQLRGKGVGGYGELSNTFSQMLGVVYNLLIQTLFGVGVLRIKVAAELCVFVM